MSTRAHRIGAMLKVALVPYLTDLAIGAVLAWPIYAVVRAAYGAHPDADQVLFDRDLEIAELVDGGGAYAEGYVVLFAIIVAVAWLVGHLVKAVVLASIAGATRPGLALGTAATAFRKMTVVSLGTIFLQAIVLGAMSWSGMLLVRAATVHTERRQDLFAVGLVGVGLVIALALGLVKDFAHGRIVVHGDTWRGLLSSLSEPRPIVIALLPSWAWHQLAVPVVTLALAGAAASWLGTRTAAAIAVVSVGHQLASFARAVAFVEYQRRVVRVTEQTRADSYPSDPSE